MGDILLDSNTMRLFPCHKDPNYIKLFIWIKTTGVLVLSNPLKQEYLGTDDNSVAVLIDFLMHEDRLNIVTNAEIKAFNCRHFKFTCNGKDVPHLKAVMLSRRKIALTYDENLRKDINRFPQFKAVAVKRPEEIDYENYVHPDDIDP